MLPDDMRDAATPTPPRRRHVRWMLIGTILLSLYLVFVVVVAIYQRELLYFPSHALDRTKLKPWLVDGQLTGYCRAVEHPHTIWFMTHGNGGQASHRDYVLDHLSPGDSLYVLEYPGYGNRAGSPSKAAFDGAAVEAFQRLQHDFPGTPIAAIGESIGSGPASMLARLPTPPVKIVLVVPYDRLASVAAERMPFLPVRLMLRDDWDNVAALRDYRGALEIYGATNDEVIGFAHAKNLAAQLPRARFTEIHCGHNDWSDIAQVRIEN